MIARYCLIFLTLPGLLCAQSARSLVSAGNDAYEAGEYDNALSAYRQAQLAAPQDALGKFNEGAALFRKEEFEEAANVFRAAAQAAKTSGDRDLEAKSLYNLGNALLQNAETSQSHDAQTALQSVKQGAAAYRQAVGRDPQLTAAAENLQIARARIADIMRQQQQQQDGSSSEDLQQQIEDQLEQQKELSEDNRQQQENPSENQQEQQQQAQQQRDLGQKSQDLADQAGQQGSPAQDQLEQAAQEQQQAAQQLQQGQPEQAEESQQRAENHLSQALEQLQSNQSEAESEQQEQQPTPQEAQGQPQPQDSTPLQALELTPEDILDQERAARQRRQDLSGQQQRPVEKDW